MSSMIVTEDASVVLPELGEFSWRAVFAGAVVAVAVTFFLLFLGSGFGLSLVSVPEANGDTAQKAITLGAIYFFAAQAFGLAVGGYLAGRLMGPVLESESEELFHASTHGLVVWAVAVLATVTMVTLSGLAVAGQAVNAAAIAGSANNAGAGQQTASNGYWVDALFRSAAPTASSAGLSDAKAEAGRILTIGAAMGAKLSQADHDQLVQLVSQNSGADAAGAGQRVDGVLARMHQQEIAAAETARQLAKYISIWLAASLCFGALVSAGAAVSGRWVDDEARA